MTEQALAGLNIVVTRPREQATSLAQHIEQFGGRAILFPLLEISPVADPQPLRTLVARLPEFNLAIFISPNAVRYGMEVILASGTFPSSIQIATVGLGSAKALRDLASRKRSIVETIIDQLKNISQIEHTRHRSPSTSWSICSAG